MNRYWEAAPFLCIALVAIAGALILAVTGLKFSEGLPNGAWPLLITSGCLLVLGSGFAVAATRELRLAKTHPTQSQPDSAQLHPITPGSARKFAIYGFWNGGLLTLFAWLSLPSEDDEIIVNFWAGVGILLISLTGAQVTNL